MGEGKRAPENGNVITGELIIVWLPSFGAGVARSNTSLRTDSRRESMCTLFALSADFGDWGALQLNELEAEDFREEVGKLW